MGTVRVIKNANVTIKSEGLTVSGQVPEGDKRLTANISHKTHTKLKMTAVLRETTIGELIEELVDSSL
jgi:hypothetical protein